MSGDNVVFLNFTSPRVREEPETIAIIACSNCRNKTFTLTSDGGEKFLKLGCAACGENLGRMGWFHEDDPAA